MDNSQLLESLLLTGTPQEAAEFFKSHRGDVNAERALAIACRFCGVEYVQALVESGVAFTEPRYQDGPNYWLAPLKFSEAQREMYLADEGEDWFENQIERKRADNNSVGIFYIMPEEQRAGVVKYLCENSGRTYFVPGELLFFSILCRDQIITARLREMGVTFTNERIEVLTKNPRTFMLNEFVQMLAALDDDVIPDVICEVVKEVGGKRLCYNKMIYAANCFNEYSLYGSMRERIFNLDFFRILLENFRFIEDDRKYLLMELIDKNQTQCLAMCAERGWLRPPHKRDEIIEYACKGKSVECTAWLLDYKNRNFDLAAERAKAEKKAMHELNAPCSMAALKKICSWRKQEDGTLILTGYAVTGAVIKIPPQIGRRAVTALGDRLFFSYNFKPRDNPETQKLILPKGLRSIGDRCFAYCGAFDEITLPDSVAEIGEGAFRYCRKLREIEIPSSVGEIADIAFSHCNVLRSVKLHAGLRRIGKDAFENCKSLEEIVVPEGTTEIGEGAFAYCSNLKTVVIPASVKTMENKVFNKSENVTVIVEQGSFAEEYCKQNNILFKYGKDV